MLAAFLKKWLMSAFTVLKFKSFQNLWVKLGVGGLLLAVAAEVSGNLATGMFRSYFFEETAISKPYELDEFRDTVREQLQQSDEVLKSRLDDIEKLVSSSLEEKAPKTSQSSETIQTKPQSDKNNTQKVSSNPAVPIKEGTDKSRPTELEVPPGNQKSRPDASLSVQSDQLKSDQYQPLSSQPSSDQKTSSDCNQLASLDDDIPVIDNTPFREQSIDKPEVRFKEEIVTVFEGTEFSLCGYRKFKASSSDGNTILISSKDRKIPNRSFRGFESELQLDVQTELWPGCLIIPVAESFAGTTRIAFSIKERIND